MYSHFFPLLHLNIEVEWGGREKETLKSNYIEHSICLEMVYMNSSGKQSLR